MFAKLKRHPAATIFVIALALRLVAALAITWQCQNAGRDFLIEGDANLYWDLAGSIANGDDYVVAGRYALRMPGFPALLALSRIVLGDDVGMARLLIAIVGAIGCVAVFFLGQTLHSTRSGWLAGLWTALSPTLVGFTPLILTEAVFATTLTLSILLLHFTQLQLKCKHSSWLFAMCTGAAVALATYIRPTWLLAAPAFAVCLWLKHKNAAALRAGLLICLTTFLALLPWGLRNQSATGHFVLTTLWLGPSLYDGLHENATGASDMQFVETDGLMVELGEVEANKHYRDEAIAFAKANPTRALSLGLIKLGRFWNPLPNAEQFQSFGPRAACLIGFVPLMVLTVRGAWMQRGDWWTLAMCLSPILYFSLLHVVFVGSLRYRLPAEYPLSVLAACGLSRGISSSK
jgi:4-amino-4-deoxy-L-arabinose transferase-like glycosyltransferase